MLTLREFSVVLAPCCLAACTTASTSGNPLTVGETPSKARASDGRYISWREHLVDDELSNGGVAIRGGDGLVMGDIDRDGFEDIVSVHEDSNHLRIAFGSPDPDSWDLVTVAEGEVVAAIEDVALGDLDGDGWPDLVAACEEAHLAFFKNPGGGSRTGSWQSNVPAVTQGRGSWLRVFIADVTGDGTLDVIGANKGASDIIDPDAPPRSDRTTSLFRIEGNPLKDQSWREQTLLRQGVPNTGMPVDIDGDGDLDVLAAARLKQQAYLLVNLGRSAGGEMALSMHPITIENPEGNCLVSTSAFQADFADLNGDGRLDLIVGVSEKCGEPRAPHGLPALAWLQQSAALDEPWSYHRIGDTQPDTVIGIEVADFDGDGDLDVITGGYSGLNIIRGGYSDAQREFDSAGVTATATVGRIAWFENPGTHGPAWNRHDITRTVRGMYDAFIARDMDGDGDLDVVTTRGNSGKLDGVIWLEQVRTSILRQSFIAARKDDSRALPLPPVNWLENYGEANTLIAPNKRN